MSSVPRLIRQTTVLRRTGGAHPASFALGTTSLLARATPSPDDPTKALVVVLDGGAVPMAEHYMAWCDELAARGYERIRTGALSARQAVQADVAGLRVEQELELLQLDAPLPRPGGDRSARPVVRRLRMPDYDTAAIIDRAAFGDRWWLDAGMLADVCHATPRHRARVAEIDRSAVGSLISGRSGSLGYIQRLSVHPRVHRRGVGTALLADALSWMRRAGVSRVFVNTHIDNEAALALYHRIGFRSLPERLRVFEGSVHR